jgi:hypothetical protein
MQRSKKYTFGYILYESFTFLLEFISYLNQNSLFVYSLPSYFYCLQGLWDLTVIFYSNWSEITWDNMNPIMERKTEYSMAVNVAQEGLLLQPHLNTALRAEVLYFTTQGIMFAAKAQCAADEKKNSEDNVERSSNIENWNDLENFLFNEEYCFVEDGR